MIKRNTTQTTTYNYQQLTDATAAGIEQFLERAKNPKLNSIKRWRLEAAAHGMFILWNTVTEHQQTKVDYDRLIHLSGLSE